MKHMNLSGGDFVPHKVYVNLYIFCMLMLNEIDGKIDNVGIVTVDNGGLQ